MSTAKKSWTRSMLGLTLIMLVGCGGPERQGVHGKVTLDGAPVDGGTISFLPADGKPDSVARGDIKAGSYSIPAGQGPVVGAYRIEIRWMRKTGRMVSGFGTQAPEMASVVPERYNRTSELKADIKLGQNELDYPLTSK